MSVVMTMDHSEDPKQKILKELGDISNIEIFNNQLLCAVYVRPTKTKSGLYLTDKFADEDKFQGKCGLLVGMGPAAFQDDTGQWFNDTSFQLHDWLVFRASDGWSLNVNGVLCRMLSDTQIKLRIPSPDVVF